MFLGVYLESIREWFLFDLGQIMSGFIETEEEKLFRSVVRKFAKDNLVPRAQHADEMEEFSWDNWRGMASIGLTGIGVSSELGGSGGGYRHTVIAEEEIADVLRIARENGM